MTAPQWAPAEILNLNPLSSTFTCVGHAPSKGRRCRNAIACVNRQEGAKILLQMSRLDPRSQTLDDKLYELASRLLCRRWHQNQVADMKRKWQCSIELYLARRGEDEMAERGNNAPTVDEAEGGESSEENVSEIPTPEQPSRQTAQHHAHHRREIEGDCSICCEDLTTAGDTVWCRARCGQNFHADCIGLWLASQEIDRGRRTCPYW